jgi:hypothetical protein
MDRTVTRRRIPDEVIQRVIDLLNTEPMSDYKIAAQVGISRSSVQLVRLGKIHLGRFRQKLKPKPSPKVLASEKIIREARAMAAKTNGRSPYGSDVPVDMSLKLSGKALVRYLRLRQHQIAVGIRGSRLPATEPD